MRYFVLALAAVLSLAACQKKSEPAPAAAPAPAPAAPEAKPAEAPAPTAATTAAATEPGNSIGKVVAIAGNPKVSRAGGETDLKKDDPLLPGDRVSTADKTRIHMELKDGSVIKMGRKSAMVLNEYSLAENSRTGKITPETGRFWANIVKRMGTTDITFDCPTVAAGIRGTTFWGDIDEVDAFCSLEGEVEVKSKKNASLAPSKLTAGNCAANTKAGKLDPLAPKEDQVKGFLAEFDIP
ncbi:MAG: hypothetical protein GMKNLPBB_01160 [Myxococcota bacterium]|nr:hypothetical protein [Myxococcota bacterium]